MLVRVFDKQQNAYFKSEVYAVINSGCYEKRLVVVSVDGGGYFKFFDFLDQSDPEESEILINTIVADSFSSDHEWVHHKSDDLDKILDEYAALLDDDVRFNEYRGYSWIYQDKPLLTELLKGSMVSVKKYESQMFAPNFHQLEGWNYVEKQQDIDFLLEQTYGLHDSILNNLHYISGSYADEENNGPCTDSLRQVTMQFDSIWCRSIEMVFEGVIAMNLRPHTDNELSDLDCASLFVQDETVFFFDSYLDGIDLSYSRTWIAAYGLRWRFYGQKHNIPALN